MATPFRRISVHVTNTPLDVVSAVPAATAFVLIGAVFSNDTLASIKVTMTVTDATGTFGYIKSIEIPSGASLSPLDGKLVLNAGDTLTVVSDTASCGDFTLSYLVSV